MNPQLPSSYLNAPLAHRALHDVTDGRPENSLAAIKAARTRGFGIEIDVQLSADDHAMVFHDYQMDRLTGEAGLPGSQIGKISIADFQAFVAVDLSRRRRPPGDLSIGVGFHIEENV